MLLWWWLHKFSLSLFSEPPGSLLPYNPDAPLWQGLQNVQQDFPLTRVRHHGPSWRQWVVANIFFVCVLADQWWFRAVWHLVMKSHWVVTAAQPRWRNPLLLFFVLLSNWRLTFLRTTLLCSVSTRTKAYVLLYSSKGMSDLRRPGALRVSRLLWGRGYHCWQD